MAVQTPTELVQKKCKPCEGGVDPYSPDEAREQLKQLRGWKLTHDGQRIRKDWKVKNFMAGMDFFNDCAKLAEEDGHHPDLHIEGYRNVSVELWTHAIGGLSENDFILAAKIDELPIEVKNEMTPTEPFVCYLVRKDTEGRVTAGVESVRLGDLPPGDVLVRVAYSSLNYKDALASQGHPGVVRSFPHVPGIDCAGTVVESTSPNYRPNDAVLITGYELGGGHWGGYSEYVRVPADWIVPLPAVLSAREAMIYGTAGFTAAQCVNAIVERGIGTERGPILVTGATGGVGCIAVAILAKLGFHVAAVTGKADQHDWLRMLGAKTMLSRNEVYDDTDRPLLQARWAAAVDTVGGRPLATILRSVDHRGCVAACGLVAGAEIELTVYPFILRGVTLAGIDSAKCPRPERLEMWRKLAGAWRVEQLDRIATEVTLDELPERVREILAGRIVGRTLVVPQRSA